METAKARMIEKSAFIVQNIRCCHVACAYLRRAIAAALNRRFKLSERRQLFIDVHNEAFSVATVRVSGEDDSPARINR
jgi:hypothetical protein